MKLTAICNLDCTYCYMFNLADQTHRRVPRLMDDGTAAATVRRIRSYVDDSDGRFSLILHGGEPTLWPLSSFEALFAVLASADGGEGQIDVSLQTNAYRPLEGRLLELLDEHGVTIGISVDGPAAYHDRYRVTKGGRGSYDRVMRNAEAIVEAGYGHLIGGFLAVAQPDLPVDEYLGWIETLPVRKVDVLWPMEFTQDSPPWRGDPEAYARQPRYGAWFADLFKAWWRRDDPDLVIRSFNDVLQVLLGARSHLDGIVNDTMDLFAVNTDGGIEYPDYLRVAMDGATRTAWSVLTDDLADVHDDPLFDRLLRLADECPDECRDCPHEKVCGGGFLPGRTSAEDILSPRKSVLCADQFHFFSTVKETTGLGLDEELADEGRKRCLTR